MHLSPKALGLSAGILWGVSIFGLTLIAVNSDSAYGAQQLEWLVGFYPWYEVTNTGAFVGLVDGFVDAFVGGFLLALLYNWTLHSCSACEMCTMPKAKKKKV